ncbi:hypothetical protein BDW42DRAFT_181566 [Aspergillus taichungensis]|uniref:Molybdopterin synthase sulfur carrier subunit n=1 Tax=Aspergillus taichungensis TaxID=482145 RepID=A0A2J5HDK6_9EURO|nr:hypothetical protein BDW42DRAFT_181566 [Aspergillus taichungensis]
MSENATFQIHYFSTASAYTGKSTERLPAPLPVARLFDVLEERYPGMRKAVLGSCGLSVGDEYVDLDAELGVGQSSEGRVVIKEGEEVAVIPPVSSG